MKYQPIGDGILLEKLEAPGTSKGGILLPPQVREAVARGKVVAVGEGYAKEPMHIKVDDEVLYAVQREFPIDDFVLVAQRDVFCICIDDGIDHVHRVVSPVDVN